MISWAQLFRLMEIQMQMLLSIPSKMSIPFPAVAASTLYHGTSQFQTRSLLNFPFKSHRSGIAPLSFQSFAGTPSIAVSVPGNGQQWRPLRLRASEAQFSASTASSEKWIFEFVGDGKSSHLSEAVSPPTNFEVVSDVAIIGRGPENADIVIPIATVSGLHARVERKEGMLFVTDMSSTNGTYVNNKKIPSGTETALPNGSIITFGDVHLARYQISKIEVENPPLSQETKET